MMLVGRRGCVCVNRAVHPKFRKQVDVLCGLALVLGRYEPDSAFWAPNRCSLVGQK